MRQRWAGEGRGRRPEDFRPDMPPVEPALEYLLGYLYEVGPSMGDGPITHQEWRAWQSNTGIELRSWEARFLRRLSQEFLSALRAGEKRDAKPPWQTENAKPMVTDTQAALRALAGL